MRKEVSLFVEVCLLQERLVYPWRLLRFQLLSPLGIVDAKCQFFLLEFGLMFQEQGKFIIHNESAQTALQHTCGSSYPVNITVYFTRFCDGDNLSAFTGFCDGDNFSTFIRFRGDDNCSTCTRLRNDVLFSTGSALEMLDS